MQHLAGLALGAATSAFGLASEAREESLPSLKEVAASRGLQYGADCDPGLVTTPAAYQQLFLQQCALYAANLAWGSISKAPDTDDFTNQTRFRDIDLVTSQGLRLTGAHLLWPYSAPDWFKNLDSPQDMEAAVLGHISRVTGHYAGKVWSWNVVNELINPAEGRPDGLRNEVFVKKMGPEVVDLAYRAARKGDPNALLAYNDYDFERDTDEHELRRRALINLVSGLVSRGVPIDAVGLQSHLVFDGSPAFDESKVRGLLRELASTGVKIIVTELDVLDKVTADIPKRDRMIADVYAHYLDVVLDERAVVGVVTWGLSDRYTWLTPKFNQRFARPDGQPARPLPFDDAFQPKPAFEALLKAFKHARPR